MTEILLGLILVVVIVASVCLIHRLGKQKIYIQPKQFKKEDEVTTVLPVPLHAITCDHDWDTLSDHVLDMPHEKKSVLVLACRRCGAVDKTVQITSPAPPPETTPCKHDWQVAVEQNMDMPHEKKVVVVMTCSKCGEVDKTVETTSKQPAKEWSKEECRHKWEAEKRVTLDSAYEQMLKSLTTKSYKNNDKQIDLDLNAAPSWMFRKKYVYVRTCSVCGEIDKVITSNFDDDNGEEWPETLKMDKKAE